MKIGKTHIELKTFLLKGTPKIDDSFGLYCITGKQGSGKTYYAAKLAYQNLNKVKKIKTNIRSLFQFEVFHIKGITQLITAHFEALNNEGSMQSEKVPETWETGGRKKPIEGPIGTTANYIITSNNHIVPIEYFSQISDIYYDDDDYCMYIIDEISRKYSKNDKCDVQFYAWLNQCRKTHRMCILITQEYKELPMWLRRPIKYQLSTQPTRLLGRFGIFTTYVGDGENPILNPETLEWECPIISKIISKRNMKIANLYDTFETVPFL